MLTDRAGHRDDLEPAAPPAGQRRGRAVAGGGEELGRAVDLCGRGRVAAAGRGTDRLQREAYAGPGERSRWQEFPGLAHAGRSYWPEVEGSLWDLERVKRHLARYVVRRKVDPLGKVSIYSRPRPVSRAWIGKVVNVGFDAEECCWVATADDGQELRRIEAPEVSREAVMGLRMCYRLPCRPAPHVEPVGRDGEAQLLQG